MARISKIKMPNGSEYNIYDPLAIHEITPEMLESLGISSVLTFKGTITSQEELPTANESTIGHVYLNKSDNTEYVGVSANSEYYWEVLGGLNTIDWRTF